MIKEQSNKLFPEDCCLLWPHKTYLIISLKNSFWVDHTNNFFAILSHVPCYKIFEEAKPETLLTRPTYIVQDANSAFLHDLGI